MNDWDEQLFWAVEQRDADDVADAVQAVTCGAGDPQCLKNAVYWAVSDGHAALAEAILGRSDIHRADLETEAGVLLYMAVTHGQLEMLELLLRHGAKIVPKSEMRSSTIAHAAHWAKDETRIAILQRLLATEESVDLGDGDALISAACYGRTEAVRMLLAKGADIHVEDDKALQYAVQHSHVATARLLLERGADVHADSDNALREAIPTGNTEMVALLLDHDADLHVMGDYALRLAASYHSEPPSTKYHGIIRLLLDHGADIYAMDDNALQLAVANKDMEVLAMLVSTAGADADAPYREHYEYFRANVRNVLGNPPEARLSMMFEESAAASQLMRCLTAAGMLPHLFANDAWPDQEDRTLARECHARLRKMLPEYQNKIDAVDMTPFQPEAPVSFVENLRSSLKEKIPVATR